MSGDKSATGFGPPWWRVPAAWFAIAAAVVPFLPGLTGFGVFYIRDLSLFFWGRHIWLRRELWSGAFPLWDPYIGAGQSAAADALHQLFLLPAVAVRLIGSEMFGFNLWVALPFPLAALGAWLFFRSRFSAPATTIGAIAFSLSGPILSTFNFPNLSWSAAAVPWVLWAADRAGARPTPRRLAPLAVTVALQALAGEPVTLLATLVLTMGFVLVVTAPPDATPYARSVVGMVVAVGVGIGLALAAIQLIPLQRAAAMSDRAAIITTDLWSLHPVALLETVSLHLFGNYYSSNSPAATPWFGALHNGREPFLFSIYFGVPLLAVAAFGLTSGKPRRWTRFWMAAAVVSVVCAFGIYSPVYPFLRDHLPLLGSFRFPAKYLVVFAMAIAAAAAAGWDALAKAFSDDATALKRARFASLGLAATVSGISGVAAATCLYFPRTAAFQFYAFARHLHVADPVAAAEFMLRTLPAAASALLILSIVTVVVLHLSTAKSQAASGARQALFALIVIDLLVHGYGLSPVLDPRYLAEPAWLSYVQAHPDSRFYIGGKRDGTLDAADLDSGGAYVNPPGLIGSASRAALNGQANFYPSAWHTREMLSHDLPVLWPKQFATMTERFLVARRVERDRFLDRTGVRFRVLPRSQASGRTAVAAVPYLLDSFLYDCGSLAVAPRVTVIGDATVVSDAGKQIEALFEDGWDHQKTVLVERIEDAAGEPGPPAAAPTAHIVTDGANRVVVEAAVPAGGGYLVMLDSYSSDWRVNADARPATVVRANGLFRAVRLSPGAHVVEFVYRPPMLIAGAVVSGIALAALAVLLVWPLSRRTVIHDQVTHDQVTCN
jgi:hypothetical protein